MQLIWKMNCHYKMSDDIVCDDENLQILFHEASLHIKAISSKLSEEQLLQFYGYYKQAVEGPCLKPKPSWYQLVEKQKWEVWSSLKNMDRKEAMRKYVDLLNDLDGNWDCATDDKTTTWVHHSCMKDGDEKLEDSDKTIFDWVKESNLSKVKSLLNTGLDVNKLDENRLTLLHWAADRGNLEIVKYLIQHFNADVNVQDGDGQTPLHYASFCDHEEVVKYLLESGTDTNIKDFDGNMACNVTNNANIKALINKFERL